MKKNISFLSDSNTFRSSISNPAFDWTEKSYPSESFKWYHKAYQQGCEESIVRIAYAYFHGYGIKKDMPKAFSILKENEKRFPNNTDIKHFLLECYKHEISRQKK